MLTSAGPGRASGWQAQGNRRLPPSPELSVLVSLDRHTHRCDDGVADLLDHRERPGSCFRRVDVPAIPSTAPGSRLSLSAQRIVMSQYSNKACGQDENRDLSRSSRPRADRSNNVLTGLPRHRHGARTRGGDQDAAARAVSGCRALPLDHERRARELTSDPFLKHSGVLSPDGRWFAYRLDRERPVHRVRATFSAGGGSLADLDPTGRRAALETGRTGALLPRRLGALPGGDRHLAWLQRGAVPSRSWTASPRAGRFTALGSLQTGLELSPLARLNPAAHSTFSTSISPSRGGWARRKAESARQSSPSAPGHEARMRGGRRTKGLDRGAEVLRSEA
jgi:hypothetical protein